ncbi:MAG: hypothetical protein RL215_1265, partial [Planctomycetota bacterium]
PDAPHAQTRSSKHSMPTAMAKSPVKKSPTPQPHSKNWMPTTTGDSPRKNSVRPLPRKMATNAPRGPREMDRGRHQHHPGGLMGEARKAPDPKDAGQDAPQDQGRMVEDQEDREDQDADKGRR